MASMARLNVPEPDHCLEDGQPIRDISTGRPLAVAFRENRWTIGPNEPPGDPRTVWRRAEFAAGRRVLGKAGEILGLDLSDLPVASTGAPVVPQGCAASLTHTGDYVAAVASIDPRITMLGVDAEPWAPLDSRTTSYIATEAEASEIEAMGSLWPTVPWGRILFTAKEATFKALSQARVRVRFGEASVLMRGHALEVTCRTPAGVHQLRGCWSHRKTYNTVFTLLWGVANPAAWTPVAACKS